MQRINGTSPRQIHVHILMSPTNRYPCAFIALLSQWLWRSHDKPSNPGDSTGFLSVERYSYYAQHNNSFSFMAALSSPLWGTRNAEIKPFHLLWLSGDLSKVSSFKSGGRQNVASCAPLTAKYTFLLVFASQVHSTSLSPIFLKHWVTCVWHGLTVSRSCDSVNNFASSWGDLARCG